MLQVLACMWMAVGLVGSVSSDNHRWAFFRVAVGGETGKGHLSRCNTLATAFQKFGIDSIFVLSGETVQTNDILGNCVWIDSSLDEKHDAIKTISALDNKNAHVTKPYIAVVDCYDLGSVWETEIKSHYRSLRLLAIDDLYNRKHAVDCLLDTGPNRKMKDYSGLLRNGSRMLLGPEYALIPPSLVELGKSVSESKRISFSQGKAVEQLLITFGGGNNTNLLCNLMPILSQALRCKSDVIVTVLTALHEKEHDQLEYLQSIAPTNFNVVGYTNKISKYYALADLCIGAAGVSALERCCMGLPSVNFIVADNQTDNAFELDCIGAAINAGVPELSRLDFTINEIIVPFLDGSRELEKMSRLARNLCDGRGASIVAKEQIYELTKIGGMVSLREAHKSDIDLVYGWQILDETRKYANDKAIPTYENHSQWMKKQLELDDVYFNILMLDGIDVGVLKLNSINEDNNTPGLLISIYICPKHFRKGIARCALKIAKVIYSKFTLFAEILPENTASIELFKSEKFIILHENLYVFYGNKLRNSNDQKH